MSSARSEPPKAPRLFETLGNDLGQVAEDIRRRGLHQVFSTALHEVEAFYLDEDSRRRLAGMGRLRRTIRRIFWLLKSLLLKLTPARRILLALALLLLLPVIHIGSRDRNIRIDLQSPTTSAVLIVVVLILELKDKLIARNELVAGRAVQLALMPPESPAIPGWDVWLYTAPANDVGGDLVDHVPIDAHQHGIALGDVAGKALPAALLMVKLQATVRALVPIYPSLDDLGAGVNRILHRDGLPNRFATLVYLLLTTDSGRVRCLNAGHLPPLVLRGSHIEELPAGSMALGFIPDAEYREQAIDLAPGDTLVVFSDGVIEAVNATDDFFGDERLRSALQKTAGRPAQEVGRGVLTMLEAFVGETKPHDDVSVVVVRRTP